MGVGGWKLGKDCPEIELVWKKGRGESAGVFFRMKSGKEQRLGVGMAIFSPDCKKFWFTPFQGNRKVSIYDAKLDGHLIAIVNGRYPAWSPDSLSIYMTRTSGTLQLWRVSVVYAKEELVYKVSDFRFCYAPGEGVSWLPVTFDSSGNIIWSYATDEESSKQLLIDAQTHKLIKEEKAQLECE